MYSDHELWKSNRAAGVLLHTGQLDSEHGRSNKEEPNNWTPLRVLNTNRERADSHADETLELFGREYEFLFHSRYLRGLN